MNNREKVFVQVTLDAIKELLPELKTMAERMDELFFEFGWECENKKIMEAYMELAELGFSIQDVLAGEEGGVK